MRAVVGPVGGDQRLTQVLQGRVAGVLDLRLQEDDPVRAPALLAIDGADAAALRPHADLGLLVHLDLGDQVAARGIEPGELDARRLADHAPPPVAPDQVVGPKRRLPGQFDIHAGPVLREAHHLVLTQHRDAELVDPASQDDLDVLLPEGQDVVVASREVADVQERPRVADERVRLARRDEPIGDAALVEHLERAGVEPPGPPSVELLVGPTLDDEDVDPRERQLGRQHQPGRSPSRDHHLVLSHRRSTARVRLAGSRSMLQRFGRRRTHPWYARPSGRHDAGALILRSHHADPH